MDVTVGRCTGDVVEDGIDKGQDVVAVPVLVGDPLFVRGQGGRGFFRIAVAAGTGKGAAVHEPADLFCRRGEKYLAPGVEDADAEDILLGGYGVDDPRDGLPVKGQHPVVDASFHQFG